MPGVATGNGTAHSVVVCAINAERDAVVVVFVSAVNTLLNAVCMAIVAETITGQTLM